MNKLIIFFSVLILIVAAESLHAQTERIKFARGENSATVEGGIARGEVYNYLIKASRGQFMTVTIYSTEENAVFQIINKKTGEYLPGAEDGKDIMRWDGELPSSGDYKIIVGSTRGGAEYKLNVIVE